MAEETKNPYPPGSARAKLWARREADRRKKEGGEKKTPPKGDVEKEMEGLKRPSYFKNQTTDSNNE